MSIRDWERPEWLLAGLALFLAALLVIMTRAAYLEGEASARCRRVGYVDAKSIGNAAWACLRLENGTQVLRPLAELERERPEREPRP